MDEIEVALAHDFDSEHLSVYADYLQSKGDPRGDWIALDLAGIADGRDELFARWLGDDVVALLARSTLEVGFITDLYLDDESPPGLLDFVLASPLGAFIRGATIHGSPETVASALTRLVERRHAWLDTLAVRTTRSASLPGLPASLPLATALPALRELEVWGVRVFGALAHSELRSLRMTEFDAIGGAPETGPVDLPALAVLDLAFGRATRVEHVTRPARHLPALRRLDLSRNEPGELAPHYLGGNVDACAVLRDFDSRSQLSHVRLPSVRTREQVAALTVAIAGMPALRQLSTARAFEMHRHVALPHQLVVPPAVPWWPADELDDDAVLTVVGHNHVDVPLVPIVVWLDDAFPDLPASARAAWTRVFRLVAQGPRMTITRAELLPALRVDAPLDELADAVTALGDSTTAVLSVTGAPI